MLKHILISLLIVGGIFAIPAVLLFAATVFSDAETAVEQQQNTEQVTDSPSPRFIPEQVFSLFSVSEPEAVDALMSKSWFEDGLTEDEAEAAELLGLLSYEGGSASQLLSMPFLETVEEADVLALASLYQLALLYWTTLADPSEFEEFMSHPAIADGVTDEETIFVTVAGNAYEWNPGLIDTLLDPAEVMSERRTIELPIAGEVELVIVRIQPGSAKSMDLLEESVRFAESYMGEAFPINLILLLYADAVKPGFAGHNSGAGMVVHPDFDGDDELGLIVSHEVAHFYWRGSSQVWLDEGAAEFLSVADADRLLWFDMTDISPVDVMYEYDCADGTTLKSLETLPGPQAEGCDYALGFLFFLDLHQALGPEDFQQGFRELYLAGEGVWDPESWRARNMGDVRDAFESSTAGTDTIISDWWDDR